LQKDLQRHGLGQSGSLGGELKRNSPNFYRLAQGLRGEAASGGGHGRKGQVMFRCPMIWRECVNDRADHLYD
jgi:hypothetical protein